MNIDIEFLKEVLSLQSDTGQMDQVSEFIVQYVSDLGLVTEIDLEGNLYVRKGTADIFPTIVAHMDTVHPIVPDKNFQIVQAGDILLAIDPINAQPRGIGGDDKVGIFIALTLLKELKNVKVAFFVDEEIGCVGSAAADMSFFKDATFVLQADRKGSTDFIRTAVGTQLYSDAFGEAVSPFLKEYGFTTYNGGSITDVQELKDKGLQVSCANVSAGYYNAHTSYEMVKISDVNTTLNLFRTICKVLGFRKWKHLAPKPVRRVVQRYQSFRSFQGGKIADNSAGNQAYWKDEKKWEMAVSTPSSFTPITPTSAAARLAEDRAILLQAQEMKKIKDEIIEKYLPESEGDSYMNAIEDDETDRSRSWNRVRGVCPMCRKYDSTQWDATEESFFCMVCQDYFSDDESQGELNDMFGEDWPPKAIITGRILA